MPKLQLITLWISFGLLTLLVADRSVGQLVSSGQTTAELVRSRGYEATMHTVKTKDGYTLSLVQATNPLIKQPTKKDPILCVHGILVRAAFFLVNPDKQNLAKDNTGLNISGLSLKELNEKFSGDKAADSIVYLALNVGHEVWLLNRRGTSESLGAENQAFHTRSRQSPDPFGVKGFGGATGTQLLDSLISIYQFLADPVGAISRAVTREMELLGRYFNLKYWNYTLDDQAKHDIPAVVDYVLEKSGKDKLVYLGHSCGAELAVMSLTVKPNLADKLSKVVLWSPAFNLGAANNGNLVTLSLMGLKSQLENYTFPVPPASLNVVVKNWVSGACDHPVLGAGFCKLLMEPINGQIGEKMKFVHQFSEILDTVGSHDLAQLAQSIARKKMHKYDYGAVGNQIVYENEQPPIYNVSRIKSKKISIWYGKSDTLVTPGDVEMLIDDLKVPLEIHYFNESDAFFSHFQFVFHTDVAQMLNIPTLKTIAQQ